MAKSARDGIQDGQRSDVKPRRLPRTKSQKDPVQVINGTAKEIPVGPAEFRIGFYVHDVSRMRRTLFDHEMKPLGITRSQWWVLAQLSRAEGHVGDEGMLQTDLSKLLDVGKVTIGGLIDRLESGGFVVRRADRVDRRAKRLIITPKGRRVLDQMVAVGRRLNLSILDGLSDRDIKTAEKVLSRMKGNIRRKLVPLRLTPGSHDD
ncbi:MarR family transcriptional regulator [Aquamicrobium sp.]|uniref:MarR family winged helix-turn-helix transcriptional regulator n=1 Tax=Aquamicrobium sp. TaxID=1872579 RepID=UPI002585B807|nr:MarR family transcriptional regulator [Aquamicrobium sp.]MCK9553228.1 MarR family transcriptional regulator [Aquamicrobium sp.]